MVHDDIERLANVPVQNPVSTGLKLSYDDDEPNSSVSSASGSMNASASIIMSLGDNIKTEMERQKKEFDQYLKTQVWYNMFFTSDIIAFLVEHLFFFVCVCGGVGDE